MYLPLYHRRLRTMTAADDDHAIPSLLTLIGLPTISMSLDPTYASSAKSRDSAMKMLRQCARSQPDCFCEFERQVSAIVCGELPDWKIWRVDFYVHKLRLYYVDKDPSSVRYACMSGVDYESAGFFRSCAYAELVSPTSIGLIFDIPELKWQIDCQMTCSSPTGAHSIRLEEHQDDHAAGGVQQNIPRLVLPD